ncbi:MAG: tRNA 2-selenouridine(34) synthase MnmH [Ferruginibacter sp.]|nr:tRNA 2-selenouridine(34) synthase MnmH [Bacteroidota bacterium]MBX2918282.1 tRNA 2-selenouridine(34) synthase MnmH [Ferruginibacter sp.]MCB0709485.1 tRNA 2-selenouridine(34) synthase MnmH [Chitinophagaceae bacterium]MCC7378442.1 tRNA 2-selenouridine(34) synthase MnmH [Chitinophagaceae bacterium]
MPVQKIIIEEFLKLAKQYPVLDVRSPGEYKHAHILNAYSLPLFSDDERKQVGTAYKQQSRETAIKTGLDFFAVKMRGMVEETERITADFSSLNNQQPSKNIIVHCWRGGMRSAAVAWLLDMYGFKVYQLTGGYKAYRKWVLSQFEKDYNFNIVGGYTGSGKTLLLHELANRGNTIIDLEGLANHKGSAFGALENIPQPGQEMFENMLAEKLFTANDSLKNKTGITDANNKPAPAIFIEDESQRIGNLQIPMPLWYKMRKAPVFFIDIPFEHRLNYITEEYGKLKKEKLQEAILRIQKRLGGLETKNAIRFLEEDNIKECFSILLSYYDKWYNKGLQNRENLSLLLNKIPCAGVDTAINTQKLLSCNTVSA